MNTIVCERCGTSFEAARAGEMQCPTCAHPIEVLLEPSPAAAPQARGRGRRGLFWAVALVVIGVGALMLTEARRFDRALNDTSSGEEFNDRRRARKGMFDLLQLDRQIVDARRTELQAGRSEWLASYSISNRVKASSARYRIASDMAQRFPKVTWPREPAVHDFTSVTAMELWWADQRSRYEIPESLVSLR